MCLRIHSSKAQLLPKTASGEQPREKLGTLIRPETKQQQTGFAENTHGVCCITLYEASLSFQLCGTNFM